MTFSGNRVDCYVKYQSGNTTDIVTNCTDGKTYNIDTDSQYNPKDLIFRATYNRDDNWLIVYNKTLPNIWCYSPNESPKNRLVKNETKCRANINQSKLFVDYMDSSLLKDIEGVVDYGRGNDIYLSFVFLNINGKPFHCYAHNCNLIELLSECFPPRVQEKTDWSAGCPLNCTTKHCPLSGNTGDIVTECINDKNYNTDIDTDSQYNPKDLIFRATDSRDDNWLIVYDKTDANIWCYSPNESPKNKLVKNETKCRANMKQNKLIVDSINPSLRKDIEAVVDIAIDNDIFVYYIFFNINGKPKYCTQSFRGSECNSRDDLIDLFAESYPPRAHEKGWSAGLIVLITVVVMICVQLFCWLLWCWKLQHTTPLAKYLWDSFLSNSSKTGDSILKSTSPNCSQITRRSNTKN
ncbi:unnamed protein product [Medioppia subpectinata]|uniref:Uncharacterized protein n=1 Tax=Medioppia subpectinata TaxID=1979941 RepID=A0A7R9KZH7_9ACAR|nr:unnamed protein product [Medioppia subpectinata]CAG2112550.1 unnamed protein product [Medioppia subpectinata]